MDRIGSAVSQIRYQFVKLIVAVNSLRFACGALHGVPLTLRLERLKAADLISGALFFCLLPACQQITACRAPRQQRLLVGSLCILDGLGVLFRTAEETS